MLTSAGCLVSPRDHHLTGCCLAVKVSLAVVQALYIIYHASLSFWRVRTRSYFLYSLSLFASWREVLFCSLRHKRKILFCPGRNALEKKAIFKWAWILLRLYRRILRNKITSNTWRILHLMLHRRKRSFLRLEITATKKQDFAKLSENWK